MKNTYDLAIFQVQQTIEEKNGTKSPVINLFCRTPDDERQYKHVRVHGFEPYFFVPAKNSKYDLQDNYRVQNVEGGYKSLRDDPLKKITVQTPYQVTNMRDDFDKTYEADINFANRFIIDKEIKNGVTITTNEDVRSKTTINVHESDVTGTSVDTVAPRVCMLDIEVEDRNGFPENGEEEIISIVTHDSYNDEYVLFLQHENPRETMESFDVQYDAHNEERYVHYGDIHDGDVTDGYDPISDGAIGEKTNLFVCQSERDMLRAFEVYMDTTNPDMMLAWNMDGFDGPYLHDRYRKLEQFNTKDTTPVNIENMARLPEVSDGWGGVQITGRVVFDLLEAYKRTQFSELDSYRLDAIGEIELDVGKEHHEEDIGDMWEDDPRRLFEYNMRDVEIMVELDRKQDVVNFWNEVRSFVGCRIQDAPIPSSAVDMYVLHNSRGKFILPTKGQMDSEDFEGGNVFPAMTGIKNNISVIDLKSLYPMCMITINASPETKVENPSEYDGETFVSPNEIHFQKEPDGIIREMVTSLLEERNKKKELRAECEPGTDAYEKYDQQQGAIKVIMNSLFGVTGWERFRLYDKESAAAVTSTGRSVILETQNIVNDMGYEVVYGDTDSVMLDMGQDITVEEAKKKSLKVEEKVNEAYDEFAKREFGADEHHFEMEFEKLYRRFLQAGKKKRYCGHIVHKDGRDVDKVDITGFEHERSDIANITKQSQYKIIKMLVKDDDREGVISYLDNLTTQFLNGEFGVDTFGMPGGIGQPLDEYDTETAQVRGVKYANLYFGTNMGQGSKPKRVYLADVEQSFFDRVVDGTGRDDKQKNDYFGALEQNTTESGKDIVLETPSEVTLHNRFISELNSKNTNSVICFEYEEQFPDEFIPDYELMMEKTIESPNRKIVEAVGIDWDTIMSGQQQTGLEQFA